MTLPGPLFRLQDFERHLELFSLPAAVADVVRLTQDPEVEMEELAEACGRDAALAARLVQLSNASLFARANQVCSLREAVSFLGARTVQVAAISLCFKAIRQAEREQSVDRQAYWRHALSCSVAARILARSSRGCHPDEAFLAALLMDLSFPILLNLEFRDYVGVYARPGDAHPDEQAEIEGFEHHHAALTARILAGWGLPDHVVAAVDGHHVPEIVVSPPKATVLARVLYFAHELVRRLHGAGAPTEIVRPLTDFWCEVLERDRDELPTFLAGLEKAVIEMAAIFEIEVSADARIDEIRELCGAMPDSVAS